MKHAAILLTMVLLVAGMLAGMGRGAGPAVDQTVAAAQDAPTVPANLRATLVGGTYVDLAWDASAAPAGTAIDRYEVYSDQWTPFGYLHTWLASTVSQTVRVTGLVPETRYKFSVRACDSLGRFSDYTGPLNVLTTEDDFTPPPVPTGLRGTPVDYFTLEIAWDAVTDPGSGLAVYELFRDGQHLVSTPLAGHTDQGLNHSTVYTYQVRAVDKAGNVSDFSPSVAVATPLLDLIPPGVPVLSGQASGPTVISLGWSAVTDTGGTGLDGYELFRDGTLLLSTAATTCVNSGLAPGTSYQYRVRAFDHAGNRSEFSNTVSITTESIDTDPPPVPANLAGLFVDPHRISLRWDGVADAGSGLAGYELYRDGALAAFTPLTDHLDSGLADGVTFRYTVLARDRAGNRSAQSAPVEVATPLDEDIAPPAPAGLVGFALDARSAKVDWDPVEDVGGSGLAGYEVYRDGGLIGQTTAPTFAESGLIPNSLNTYTVKARDNAGNKSGSSRPVTVITPRAGHSLFAPHITSTVDWTSGLALLNAGVEAGPVTFTAIDANGHFVESFELAVLPPLACFQADADELFSPETLQQDVWVRIGSPAVLQGVQTFGTRDAESLVTIPLFAAGAGDLVFPYVVASGDFFTGLTLVNTGLAPATPRLLAYDEAGRFLSAAEVTIPSQGKYVRLVEQIFLPEIDPGLIRFIMLEAQSPLVGFELFGSFLFPGLAGLPPFSATVDLYRAGHADAGPLAPAGSTGKGAAGGAALEGEVRREREDELFAVVYGEIPDPAFYDVGITFSNLGDGAATVRLCLYDQSGQELAAADVPVSVREQRTAFLEDFFAASVPGGAAYLTAEATQRLMGFELVLTADWTSGPFQFDGVGGGGAGVMDLRFPLVSSGSGWQSWLDVINRVDTGNQVEVNAYGFDGEPMGQYLALLPPRGKLSESIEAMFPDAAGEIAWLRVEAGERVHGHLTYLSSDLKRLSAYLGLAGDD